jgi:hypothetical protein
VFEHYEEGITGSPLYLNLDQNNNKEKKKYNYEVLSMQRPSFWEHIAINFVFKAIRNLNKFQSEEEHNDLEQNN